MDERKYFTLNNFDMLRLFAALQVVVFHTATRFDLPLGAWDRLINAFPGVPIFFVISGFLISASYERSSSLLRYTRNRLLRILPALWMCLFLTAGCALLFGHDLLNLKGLVWLLAQMVGLIYTPSALSDFGFGSYNGALWTIPIELQFYAALPVAYWLLSDKRTRTRSLAVVALIFFGITLAYQMQLASLDSSLGEPRWAKLFRYTFVPHFYLFMVGVCLQRIRAEQSALIKGKGLYWLIAYLIVVFTLPDSVFAHVFKLIMLAVTSISLAYTAPGIASRLLAGNDVSYGIYIYHGLLHNIFFELGLNNDWTDGAYVIVLTVLVGVVSWLAVERPCIRRKYPSLARPEAPAVTKAAG